MKQPDTHQPKILVITFVLVFLLSLWAYLQTPQFVFGFPWLAKQQIIQTVAPRTEDMLKFKGFIDELKDLKEKGNASDNDMCRLIGKHFGFDIHFSIPQPQLLAVYRSMLVPCFLKGEDTTKDINKAVHLIKEMDEIPINLISSLGLLLIENGAPSEGVRLLEQGYRRGDKLSRGILASYFMNGIPYQNDPLTGNYVLASSWPRAEELFMESAADGEAYAALNLAFMSLQGRNSPADSGRFKRYLEQSLMLKNDAASAYLQAWAYRHGVGFEKNEQKAKEWEQKATSFNKNVHFYITDFFNETGWGTNKETTISMLVYFYRKGLVDMGGRRDLFFTVVANKTALYDRLQKDLIASKEDFGSLLSDFERGPPPVGKD